MKLLGLFATILAASTAQSAYAGYTPATECTNVGNTIQLGNQLAIMTEAADAQTGRAAQFVRFAPEELEVKVSKRRTLAREKRGCSARRVYSIRYSFQLRNGEPLPDAYNKLAEDEGSLNDFFLCTTVTVRAPGPDGTCE